jgi:N-acetylneuraminate synthase/sialic acid synthase
MGLPGNRGEAVSVELNIDRCRISRDGADCYVIAEIGHNHQGDLNKAKDFFRAAKECGVNAVKLQKRDNATLYTRAMYNMPYDNENSFGATYGAHREALEFGSDEYVELKRYAAEIGLTLFATAFDFRSADFLAELGMPAFKIASGDLKNTPLLKYVAALGKPMVVSTGGGTMEDVQRAYDTVMPINRNLCLLQCTASYPVEAEQMNLKVISTFRERFPDIVVGLSDHQNGIALALVAYTLGARVIEKHFTLNRAWKGTDHAFSLEPGGMRRLVRDLRRASVALGDGVKRTYPGEDKPLVKMAKKLVAARNVPAGYRLTREDIALKSPNDGLPPYELDHVVGMKTRRSLEADENISFDDLADA